MHIDSFQFIPNTTQRPHSRSLSKLRKAVKCNFCTTRSAIFRGNTNTNGDEPNGPVCVETHIFKPTFQFCMDWLIFGNLADNRIFNGNYDGWCVENGARIAPCKCCELQWKQISMGILFSSAFEWVPLLNLLWPVTGLLHPNPTAQQRIGETPPSSILENYHQFIIWIQRKSWYKETQKGKSLDQSWIFLIKDLIQKSSMLEKVSVT